MKHDDRGGRGHILPFRVGGVPQQTPVLHQLPHGAAPIILMVKGKAGTWWEKQHPGAPHPRLSAGRFGLWGARRLRSLRQGPWLRWVSCQAPYQDAQSSNSAISGAAFDPRQAGLLQRDIWMITPAQISPLVDGESQKSLKELGAPRAASKAGWPPYSARVARGTPGQPVCSFPSSPLTVGSCNLNHGYLEKCDLLQDGVEGKSS